MINSNNSAQFIGNLGADPETIILDSGSVLTKFSIAIHERYKTKAGEEVENTDWFDIEAWGKTAEIAQQLEKGNRVMVHGSLRVNEYETKQGEKRSKVQIKAQHIYKLAKIQESAPADSPEPSAAVPF